MKRSKNSSGSPWNHRPYRLFGDYLRDKYGFQIFKLPIDAGLTCPNRDGTFGTDGCIFCSEDGSASPTTAVSVDILKQMRHARERFKRSDAETRYIAYFQAYTNTYGPVDYLKKIYDTAVMEDDIVGLMIGTRPDCLPDEVVRLISTYRKDNFELWLEIGMQTMHDRSLGFLYRGHTHAQTRDAISRAASAGIDVCAHIILGVPGETWDDIMATARELASLGAAGVKFHQLHVIKGTPLEKLYEEGSFNTLSLKEYISLLADFIERIPDDMIVHRIMGDRNETELVAPGWSLRKGTVQKALEDEFHKRGTFQGFLFDR